MFVHRQFDVLLLESVSVASNINSLSSSLKAEKLLPTLCQPIQCDFSVSFQPAVEALSEREAQLALRNEIENENIDDFIDSENFGMNNGE